jgi:hypothetical protein
MAQAILSEYYCFLSNATLRISAFILRSATEDGLLRSTSLTGKIYPLACRVAEVLVDGENLSGIRKRETYEDFIALEK